ncbi:MAG: toll/interleukin-1 receptor domain-containing protein [Clostridia bacterium]|nr:toll/interleukin-1 receptor domain-containing protein [Clostridia bacterium]
MAVFKCKMCGGTIEFEPGASVGVCDSCGTKQTLPRLDDDRRANLYDRANHFRRNNEFDKAAGIYEQILNEDNTDAEAYWSLVLCRYGIEYVEDPATRKRVPTVNRAQFTSVFDDDNYKSALRYADAYQRELYESEAKEFNEIQKGILAISQKEEPFDVFICYKETDAQGRRTPDSVLANELYHQLVQEGFKVFFSRITLEDKLGTAYEPYIFAALNSAKVMVVLGTKPEHFNAVWVKNEWSRYLALVKSSGGKKTLIPAYRDMDPYDLPDEFSHLQAQDMSRLGFMQDLIRGIKKIVGDAEPKAAVKETVVIENSANVAPLLKRAFMFLEDGNWAEADAYCEKVLDQDPENAQAYFGKLMAELRVRKREGLKDCAQPFDGSSNYQKSIRFGDEKLETEMHGYISHINERNENARLTDIYNNAVNVMNVANEAAYKSAAELFKTIPGFKDADTLVEQCLEKAEICRRDSIYENGKSEMAGDSISNCEEAIKLFESISGWKDADEQIFACRRKIEEIKAKEEADRLEAERKAEQARLAAEKAAKKRKKVIAITTPIVIACIAFLIVLTTVIIPSGKYNSAMELYNAQKYEDAYKAFDSLNYKDSADKAAECLFLKQKAGLANVKAGSTIKFGFYEQDNNTSNGKEEIKWKVLAVEGNKALIISQYALDCQKYNSTYTDTTWEKCTLRTWLNGTFYNAAFGADHQKMIASSTVTADKNPSYSTSPGNNTTDKVFLLSITEVNKYFSSDSARQCQGTAYCYAQGAYKASNGNCWWWLRSPGYFSTHAAVVNYDGSVINIGSGVDIDNSAVRPALWINLGS